MLPLHHAPAQTHNVNSAHGFIFKNKKEIVMKNQDLNHSFTVNKTPKEVFDAINNVRGWWSGQIDGKTEKLGDEFTYRYKDFHRSTQKITESVPGKKVVWTVL